jgi:AraC-like DNA-binding protein
MGPGDSRAAVEFGGACAFADWRRVLEDDASGPLFATIGPESGFAGRYTGGRVGEARVADIRAKPLHLRDLEPAPGDRPPAVMLQAVVEGRPLYQSAGGEHQSLRPGQVIVRGRDPAALIRSERFARITTLCVPRHLLAPRYAAADALSSCIPDDGLPSRLLYDLIAGLGDADDLGGQQPARFIEVLGGLVALVLAARPQPPVALSELAGVRAGEILDYLRRNFSNPQLDPQTLADDLSISVRYAHKLMRLTGRSFREALIELRLEAARRAFAANGRPRQTIAEIAISVGFNDLSQFNRHFRNAFGMTPRAARRLDEAQGYEPAAADGFGPPAGGEQTILPVPAQSMLVAAASAADAERGRHPSLRQF